MPHEGTDGRHAFRGQDEPFVFEYGKVSQPGQAVRAGAFHFLEDRLLERRPGAFQQLVLAPDRRHRQLPELVDLEVRPDQRVQRILAQRGFRLIAADGTLPLRPALVVEVRSLGLQLAQRLQPQRRHLRQPGRFAARYLEGLLLQPCHVVTRGARSIDEPCAQRQADRRGDEDQRNGGPAEPRGQESPHA